MAVVSVLMIKSRLSPASLPAGRRIYAVGDVHGCDAALAALHADIADDLRRRPVASPLLIHLGDYIDRGPDSASVVARLIRGPDIPDIQVINLMGNHEHMMLSVLAEGDPEMARLWMRNGGDASLRSWGLVQDDQPAAWKNRLPPSHVAFLRALTLHHLEGEYLFVHAGVRPGIPLNRQSSDDMMWIREPFLSWTGDFGVVVVHGHTPTPDPAVRGNRIGIDTGAVLGGRLTCAVLESDQLFFINR